MRLLTLLTAGLLAGHLFAEDKKDEKKVKDEEAILGTWKVEKYDNGGVDEPSAKSNATVRLTFAKGGKMQWAYPDLKYDAEYELDPAAKPKTMNMSTERGTVGAIYALDGDTLTIAVAINGRNTRPEELKADGKGVAVMTMKRVKLEEKPAPPQVKWEYKIIKLKSDAAGCEAQLNELGKDGWELAGVVGSGSDTQMILKRPK